MPPIRVYHRPDTIEEALDLIAPPGSVPLAGGTGLIGGGTAPDEVVDLQALGLDGITAESGRLRIGAMTTLRDLMDGEIVPGLLCDLARREAPNTIRNAATVGGAVATASPDSGLLAAMLVHGASVELAGPDGVEDQPLASFLEARDRLSDRLITAVRIDPGGTSAFEATGRTPADVPVVLVAGREVEGGPVLLAATGVAPVPVVIQPETISSLGPEGDFRGSAEYRLHLARILTERVLARLVAQR